MKEIVLLLSMLTIFSALRPAFAANRSASLPAGDDAKVVRVVSADTIEVTINKTGFTIGLIGLDAPNKGECYEPQATAYVRRFLRGQTIRVVRDQSDFDANGRLMRYAYLADGQFLNEVIVKSGFARSAIVLPDQQQATQLSRAEQVAQTGSVGLWKICASTTQPPTTTSLSKSAATTSCLDFDIWLMDRPGPHQAQLATLPAGSCINFKFGDARGQYTWYPKGSKLILSDDFIAHWDTNSLSIYKNPQGAYLSDIFEIRPDPKFSQLKYPVETVTGLVFDGSIVRLNNGPNLFINDGDGKLTALVDIAQRVSGKTFTKKLLGENLVTWTIVN